MSRFGAGFVSGGGTPGNDSFTKIMLHMDGSNGGTTFTDSNAGGSAHTWSQINAFATTSTSNFKFPTAALLQGSAATGIKTPAHSDFNVGSGDFSVDFWYYPSSVGAGTRAVCGQVPSTGLAGNASIQFLYSAGKISGTLSNGAGFIGPSMTSTLVALTWQHLELVRVSGVLKLFYNGAQEGGDVAAAFSAPSSTASWGVGVNGDDTSLLNAINTQMDEFRLSVGIARHTANFTPPVSAYT